MKKGDFVIVRAHTAGVHAGYFEGREGDAVTLTRSIRLWKWWGGSLSQVAVTGPCIGEDFDNKFGAPVLETQIISPQGFEIMVCTDEARKVIESVESWTVA